ncbi:MAG TPA: integrase arm-type DNA-binding domain-containing protein [Steroidobacter sp.]
MPLTEARIRAARPREKPYKLFDGGGLYLLVTPGGGRWWRLKYRYGGRECGISLGIYPDVSLKAARERRDEARRLLASGVDPSAHRKAERAASAQRFEALAREWLAGEEKKLAPATYAKAKWLLESWLLPALGAQPIGEITPAELLGVLRRVESRGIHETAQRAKQLAGRIFRYAIATGRAERDITADLRGALVPPATRNRAAITEPARVGELLRAIDGYIGQPATLYALRLAPYVFVRPGELRAAEWREFDLKAAEWRIPASRMKMREPHIVPLSRQAVAILEELRRLTGGGRYLFPSLRTPERPISENTLNAALRRLGYSGEEMTAHGFRAMASTLLNERGFPPDVIELQLAHKERNKVRAAYNRAERLEERRKMMQAWADYLDSLRAGAPVLRLKRHA